MPLRRHELTDAQWERVKDLLPGRAGTRGRPAADNRLFLNAVVYVLKTGIPWRDLPERYGHWNSVWRRFDRWCAAGVWERVFAALCESDAGFDWQAELAELQLDSTVVKAHPVASSGRRLSGEKKATPTPGDASGAAGAG